MEADVIGRWATLCLGFLLWACGAAEETPRTSIMEAVGGAESGGGEMSGGAAPQGGIISDPIVYADDIPIAHTPGCGWETMPPPVLTDCTEPLAPGATDMRGTWSPIDAPHLPIQRIEQCGNRVVITGGRVTHDMRADGTYENGVNDVAARTCDPIRVSAQFIDGALVLRPEGFDLEVTRHLEDGVLVLAHPLAGGRYTRAAPEDGG